MTRTAVQTLGIAMLGALVALAQAGPRISGVEPATVKVGGTVTVAGENLGKETVEGVYVSDDEKDYPAALTEQSAAKLVLKVPSVKAGGYNISLKVGNNIFIQPVRITVEE